MVKFTGHSICVSLITNLVIIIITGIYYHNNFVVTITFSFLKRIKGLRSIYLDENQYAWELTICYHVTSVGMFIKSYRCKGHISTLKDGIYMAAVVVVYLR